MEWLTLFFPEAGPQHNKVNPEVIQASINTGNQKASDKVTSALGRVFKNKPKSPKNYPVQ